MDVDIANDVHNDDKDDNDNDNGKEYGYKKRDKLTPLEKEEMMQESREEMGYMLSLAQSTNAFSSRCKGLYDALSKKLSDTGGDNDGVHNHKAKASDGDIDCNGPGLEKVQLQEMERQLKSVKELVLELQVQMKELGKARDTANERERRVRRGLYRIAAGRIEVEEVLKVS